MKNFKIDPLNIKTDVPKIALWEKEFKDNHRFDSIEKFILERDTYCDIYYGLDEVIETNYEIVPVGENERKFALSIKHNDEIIGFVLALVHKIKTQKPELIVQYLVLRPDYQKNGLGSKVLKELINNPLYYFNTKISSVFARIDYNNTASIKAFKKLGFSLEAETPKYASATLNVLENINE